ncbi:MAG: 2-succinyl-6-hydroxy-2,4-cyclohexadiene-1-carboxylate synthase, partial [Veillonella sp.]|nr:2-succinyl-6-hydroxy-2,4-cyclohexadiene-1-carboxylate synthase [Veillonella sp.]
AYLNRWQRLDVAGKAQLSTAIEEPSSFEGRTIRELQQHIPDNSQVLVANSMTIRDFDYFWFSGESDAVLYGNRGVNGIDGTVSTALGLATNHQPTYLVTGDLSLFHDLNGLAVAKTHNLNLTIILHNNDGGITMSQYFCSIVDNALCNPAQRMYFDLGEYRYGLTVVGEGEPIVCFHGFSESSYTWDAINLPGYRVVRIDLIGHGDSDIPDENRAYTIPQMIEDLHTVIYHMVGESYYLMGYSMGARIALSYALQYEREIKGLILESGSVGIASEAERAARRKADEDLAVHIEEHDGAWFAARWAEVPIFESQKQLSEGVEELIYLRRSNNSPYALACTLRGSGQGVMPYVGDKLKNFSVKGLYVSGALDTKYTTIGRDVFGKLPSFNHVIVDGAGHNVHIEKPQIFEQAVLDFLQKKG